MNEVHPIDQLPFYVAGTLTEDERDRVERHLAKCVQCSASVDEWRRLREVVRLKAARRVRHLPRFQNSSSYSPDKNGAKMTTYTPSRPNITFAATLALFMLLISLLVVRWMPTPYSPFYTTQVNFDTLEPITVDNANQLRQVGEVGKGFIYNAVWSPDSTTLALATATGVYLNDVQLNETPLGGYRRSVINLDYSADGEEMAVQLSDGIEIWDADTGEVLKRFDLRTIGILDFSPDGSLLVVVRCDEYHPNYVDVCERSTVGLIEVESGEFIRITEVFRTVAAAFSPDGERLAIHRYTRDEYNLLQVWVIEDLLNGQRQRLDLLRREDSFRGFIASQLQFSRDGILLGASFGNTLRIWDMESGKEQLPIIHTHYKERFEFIADGNTIRYIDNDNANYRLNVSSFDNEPISSSVLGTEVPHQHKRFRFSTNGDYLSGIGNSGRVEIWEASEQPQLLASTDRYSGHIDSNAVFSYDDTLIAFYNSGVEVWDYMDETRLVKVPWNQARGNSVSFASDDTLYYIQNDLDSDSYNFQLGIWQRGGEVVSETFPYDRPAALRKLFVTAEGDMVGLVERSVSDEFTLVRRNVGGTYSDAVILMPADGDNEIAEDGYYPEYAQLSDDGKVLAITRCVAPDSNAGCREGGIALFDAETGAELLEIQNNYGIASLLRPVLHFANERYLLAASGCVDENIIQRRGHSSVECLASQVTVWDVTDVVNGEAESAEVVFSKDMSVTGWGMVDISPDGKLIAATTPDVTIYSIESGEALMTLPREQWVESLTFNPDGTLLAVGTQGMVKLWGVE
jgi:WD40 repeat protein